MNIKNIGKELMGKSLNSYHKKTGLTQLEKNNKMQDRILNGVLSQVDNAYIEKTKQSNAIHLDGSGDGVVVLNSIEGNTMFNLCSKRTFKVVGNGISLIEDKYELPYRIPNNTTLTICFKIKSTTTTKNGFIRGYDGGSGNSHTIDLNSLSDNYFCGTFKVGSGFNGIDNIRLFINTNVNNEDIIELEDFMILIGDYTDKDINFFEGLQSSFEEKVNNEGKYEIDILMNNKNLISVLQNIDENPKGLKSFMKDDVLNINGSPSGQVDINYIPSSSEIVLLKGKNYRLNFEVLSDNDSFNSLCRCAYRVTKRDGTTKWLETFITYPLTSYIINGDDISKISKIRMHAVSEGAVFNNFKVRCQLEITEQPTNYVINKQNKIKLLLNEPMRAIDDVKDVLCVKDGKLVVERRCDKHIIDGTENWATVDGDYSYNRFMSDKCLDGNGIDNRRGLCDKLVLTKGSSDALTKKDMISLHDNKNYSKWIYISSELDLNAFRTQLSNNPITLIYERIEPIYEEVLNEYGEPIILEGYENGILYIDSIIVPTTTVKYTPKVEALKELRYINENNTLSKEDINENIIPYMMDIDMMIMEKEISVYNTCDTKKIRLIGEKDMTNAQKRTETMLERLFRGKTLTELECKERVLMYLDAEKITQEQANRLFEVIMEVYQ